MNSKLLRLVLLLVVMTPLFCSAQTNDYSKRKCYGYQRDSCAISKNIYYRVVEESRSALFVKGQTSRIKFTIYNGRDYRVSFCYDKIFGEGIIMSLIDAENGNMLYDNSEDGFATEFEFTVTQTREIYIEISIPGSSDLVDAENNDELIFVRKDAEMGCVGILIEHMITPPKGF